MVLRPVLLGHFLYTRWSAKDIWHAKYRTFRGKGRGVIGVRRLLKWERGRWKVTSSLVVFLRLEAEYSHCPEHECENERKMEN